MSTVESLLRRVPLFRSLESAEIAYLADQCRVIDVAPGTIFIEEDALGDSMYVIGRGQVEIIKALGTPEESLLAVYGEGELVGEMSLLNPAQPRSASARTRDSVRLLVVTRRDIEGLLPRFPGVASDFLRIMSERLYHTANTKIRDLVAKNQELNRAYAELQAAQARLIRQEVLEQELRHAQQIQQQMLPRDLPDLDAVDIGAAMLPARMVGGDLYDVLQVDSRRLALVVGDVSGKGIPAALYMALVSSLLRAAVRTADSAENVLQTINRHLCERDMDSMFVTLLYGELDLSGRTFTYVAAGHDRPLVWHPQEGMVALPPARSRPLGLVPTTLLTGGTVALTPGTLVLLVSDGVTEAMNENGEQFGRTRLQHVVAGAPSRSAQAVCDHIVAAVAAHQGPTPQADDITLLAFQLR